MLRAMIKLWFKRNSLWAMMLLIDLAEYLDEGDLKQAIDYLKAVKESKYER